MTDEENVVTDEELPTIPERVRSGIEALDAHFGDRSWLERLDVDRLDIANHMRCIVGQLFEIAGIDGGYELLTGVHNYIERESWRLGLIWGPKEHFEDVVPRLNEEWRRQLAELDRS